MKTSYPYLPKIYTEILQKFLSFYRFEYSAINSFLTFLELSPGDLTLPLPQMDNHPYTQNIPCYPYPLHIHNSYPLFWPPPSILCAWMGSKYLWDHNFHITVLVPRARFKSLFYTMHPLLPIFHPMLFHIIYGLYVNTRKLSTGKYRYTMYLVIYTMIIFWFKFLYHYHLHLLMDW